MNLSHYQKQLRPDIVQPYAVDKDLNKLLQTHQ